MREILKSKKLDNVCYEIRGPLLREAKRLEEEGYTIIKLNSGNPPAFGINAPDEIIHDAILNIRSAQAYGDSKGLFAARKAIMQRCQLIGIEDVQVEDIYVGNGVSEMIMMAMQGLLNNGDEMLVPTPDYPLWTAAINLSGGKAVHYVSDEASDWNPDLKDMESKITSRTRGIVVINPNNPTGAVYHKDVLLKIVDISGKTRPHNIYRRDLRPNPLRWRQTRSAGFALERCTTSSPLTDYQNHTGFRACEQDG